MEKQRQIKLLSIIALVVAVAGMTLGFAAFSTTLNISSSATVTPNGEDFKIVIYGMSEDTANQMTTTNDVFKKEHYTQTSEISPVFLGSKAESATKANITVQGKNIILDNMSMTITSPEQKVYYPFLVKNEGLYDVYISFEELNDATCTSTEEMTENMLSACECFYWTPWTRDAELNKIGVDNLYNYQIKAGEHIYLMKVLQYDSDLAETGPGWPDAPIEYKYNTLELEFSTVKKDE